MHTEMTSRQRVLQGLCIWRLYNRSQLKNTHVHDKWPIQEIKRISQVCYSAHNKTKKMSTLNFCRDYNLEIFHYKNNIIKSPVLHLSIFCNMSIRFRILQLYKTFKKNKKILKII